MARTQKRSANRGKAVRRVGRLHLKVADQQADFLHKTTTRLAGSKRAIAVETLNVTGMLINRRLARAILDLGFGEFFRQLANKGPGTAHRHGRPTAGTRCRNCAASAAWSTPA
ncbi:transposase [Nonomuraea sp. NPDC049504]|uniref:transposase n=1 Tax=Nonomuraea sp. NPDC049504 TaxID=3154729 RepID=UPI00342039B9